ncbi:MAG: type II secretion system F family protein [bacterium]
MDKEKKNTTFEKKIDNWIKKHLTRIRMVEKILFVSHLKTMLKAGLSLVEGLRILSQEIENKRLRDVIGKIKVGVEQGKQLSEMLFLFPKVFPRIYVSMIGAGETAGKMEEALEQVAIQMKKSHELTSKIRGAMLYPAVIVVAMIGISIEIVFFVLPKIVVMFEEMESELPLATRILIVIVKSAQNYGIFIGIGIICIIVALYYLLKLPKFKRAAHSFYLRIPIFGKIIKKINLARFTMTMSSLLGSAIPIIQAAKICADVQGNVIYKENMIAVAEALKKGDALSQILRRYPKSFPPMVTEMIMVGENSGKTEEMLDELAEYYSNEVDTTMKNFTIIIEPVIIIILGLAVAGIAVAVIMPMYSLAQSI